MSDSIKVVCRLRPLNKIEIANNGVECVSYGQKDMTINVTSLSHRSEDSKINITLPSTASSDLVPTKSTSIKKWESPWLNQSSEVSTAPYSHTDRQAEEKPGPCRYSFPKKGTQPSRWIIPRTDSSNNIGSFPCNNIRRFQHVIRDKMFLRINIQRKTLRFTRS